METHRQWFIYTLTDPRTNIVRYVGWCYDPKRRLAAHIHTAARDRSHKAHWLKGLLSNGFQPSMTIVETGYGAGWNEAERRWIAQLRAENVPLTNATDGGEGTPGCKPGPETRRKMSMSRKGRVNSPEHIAKSAAGLRGKKKSAAHCKALSAARRGNPATVAAAARASCSAAQVNRGRKQSPEHIAKRINPLIGRIRPSLHHLTDAQVRFVRQTADTLSLRKVVAQLKVGQTLIYKIRHRTAYHHVVDEPPTQIDHLLEPDNGD